VLGIINGTTNFILTKMTDAVAGGGEADYATALAEAQRLGFAERDPTADVEGFDAGAKAAIIATVAFGAKVVAGDVYHEGISRITGAEIAIAHRLGYVVKLLGIVERDSETGDISVRVHPAMVPIHHPLASVRDSFNAVFVEGEVRRFAHVLRPRCRGCADGQRRVRRRRRRGDQPAQAEPTGRSVRSSRHRSERSTRRRRSTCSASTSRRRACCMPSPACSPRTA
jgi:hypothetical protein